MSSREYYYCLSCEAPLENPAFRQVEMGTAFFDFAVCEECRVKMMNQDQPVILFQLEGDDLKRLLKPRKGKRMVSALWRHGNG